MPEAPEAKPLPNPPIFIVGHARSGTTWLFDILTSHPEVAGVFESWMFTTSNGFVPLLRSHWGDGTLATKESVIGRHPGLGQMITREETFETVRRLSLDWLGRALGPGQRYVVEKGIGEYDIMDELFADARFVHMLRDGRDVAVSMRAASETWAPEMRPHVGKGMAGSARLWRNEVLAIRQLAESAGDRFLEVRYEDMRRDPKPLARRVFDFCGIDCPEEELDRILAESSFERKKSEDHSGFVRKGKVGDWRQRFGLIDGMRFDRDAGDVLRAMGYADSRWWWLRRPRLTRG